MSKHINQNSLTNLTAIFYLLENEDEKKMKGCIRTKEKCPVCGTPFVEVSRLGFVCVEHKTTPRKFFIDLWHEGKRIKIYSDDHGTSLDSYSKAKAMLLSINVDFENKSFDPSKWLKSSKEAYYLIRRWEEFRKAHSNFKYLKQIDYAKKYVFGHFNPSTDIRDIRQSDIYLFSENIKQMASKDTISGKTVKNITGVLLSCLNHFHLSGLIDQRFSMPKIKIQSAAKNIPTLEDSLKVISCIDKELVDVYLFLITHGCRPAEARALKVSAISFTKLEILIKDGFSGHVLQDKNKTDNSYKIPINPSMTDRIKEICLNRQPDDFLFQFNGKPWSETTLRRKWNKARTKAGLPWIEFYNGVRHAYASFIARESNDIYKVSALLGHTNVNTTLKYAKLNVDSLRSTQEKVHLPDSFFEK